jgi:hypothetical protein
MAEISKVNDHGLEVLKKAGLIPDDTKLTEYALRTKITDAIEGSFSPSGLRTAGKITVVELTDSEWRPLPATALSDRNAIAIQNKSGVEMKINYTNTVGYEGIVIENNGERFYDITDEIIIYGRLTSGTFNVNIEELS